MDYTSNFNQMSSHLFKVNPAKPNQRHNFIITDFVSNYDDATQLPQYNFTPKKRGCCVSLCQYLAVVNPSYWIFLVFLGVITAFLGFFIDYSSQQMRGVIKNISFKYIDSWGVGYLVWVLFSLFFMMIAAAVGQYISRDAEGSGIPQLKSILAGVNIYKYLSFQTLIGKVIGLYSGLVSGLSIGKQGPFVHLAAGVANKLAKIKCFQKIESHQAIKKQMLAAAVAAGVASTFGAPMGGVLFSIQVTATYYMISNLWKAFFCATWSVVAFKIVQGLQRAQLFTPTEIKNIKFGWHMFGYISLGLFCGIIGALFVTIVGKIIYLRKKIQVPFFSNRWGYCAFVAFVTALCSYPIPFLQDSDRINLQQLFEPQSLSDINQKKWANPAQGFNLFTFSFLKFVLTVLAVTCPIPAGVFTPIFTLGASFGRLFGFILYYIFNFDRSYVGMYAIIGAAGVASSVTRTISVCVIVFELTGQVTFLMPLLVCVLFSYAIGNTLSISFFDLLLDMKGLPYMPALRSTAMYNMDASDIMNRNFLYLTRDSTLSDIAILLQYVGTSPKSIPVVESTQQKLLLFSVQSQSLRKYLFQTYNKISHRLDLQVRSAMNKYFYGLSAVSGQVINSQTPLPTTLIQTQKQTKKKQNNALTSAMKYSRDQLLTPQRKRSLIDEDDGSSTPQHYEQMIRTNSQRRSSQVRLGLDSQNDQMNLQNSRNNEVVDEFWNQIIDYGDAVIEIDKAPFSVFEQTPMAKIHFLFTMLSFTQLIVINKGFTVGIISKAEFLKNRQAQYYSGEGGAQIGGIEHL